MIHRQEPASGGDAPLAPVRHLRLTVEADRHRQQVSVLQASVVEEPVVAVDRVVGPLMYQVSAEGRPTWVGTLPDPFEERSFPRPNEREHFTRTLDKAMFIIQVPLPSNQLPSDFRIQLFRAADAIPDEVSELAAQLRARDYEGFELLGTVDIPALTTHADWERLVRRSGLSVRS